MKTVNRRPRTAAVVLGGLVGVALALLALDPRFVAGTGGHWTRPANDYNAYLVAWHYYVADEWRLPLFSVPAMGYPEGGSVLFNDALPLAALLVKTLYRLTDIRLNPFGWWIFLTYVFQGAMAARLACAVGAPLWASTAAAVLAIVTRVFVWRMAHVALSGHFLLLWALALHFESLRQRRPKIGELMTLLAIALLVNAYLFAMVGVLVSATLVALWRRGHLTRRDLRLSAAGVAAVGALGILAGYGILFVNPSTMRSEGFGHHSWNLAGLLLPPNGIFGFLTGVTRDATGGQYEGEAYIGHGALLLLAVCVVGSPVRMLRHVRRYRVLALTLSVLAVFAASNVVYVGGARLVAYELPQFAADLGGYFRASGRFIWPLAYALVVLPVACIARWWRPAPALAAAAIGVFLQVHENAPTLAREKRVMAQASPDLIDASRVDRWLREHQRLWQYPSWGCGGLAGARRIWGAREANRELQVQLAAARAGIPTNSVYTSRLLKDCEAEKVWASDPTLEESVLYVLSRDAAQGPGVLHGLARSSACVTVEWAVVCSRRWSRTASARAPPRTAAHRPGGPA